MGYRWHAPPPHFSHLCYKNLSRDITSHTGATPAFCKHKWSSPMIYDLNRFRLQMITFLFDPDTPIIGFLGMIKIQFIDQHNWTNFFWALWILLFLGLMDPLTFIGGSLWRGRFGNLAISLCWRTLYSEDCVTARIVYCWLAPLIAPKREFRWCFSVWPWKKKMLW